MDTSLNQSSSPPSQSSQEWTANFKSTLNRLSTQYLLLLRAASSEVALEEDSNDEVGDGGGGGGANGKNGSDPRDGGGQMQSMTEPPPPLSASISLSTLQTKLSTQNIINASNTLLDLIRIMRVSALVMDGERVRIEEDVECWEDEIVTNLVKEEGEMYEKEWIELRMKEMEDVMKVLES